MNNCAVCNKPTEITQFKVKDSHYGYQYLCELACWDAYEGYYCERCQLLHDFDTNKTQLSNDDYCAATDLMLESAGK
jgi:hypothetical protein